MIDPDDTYQEAKQKAHFLYVDLHGSAGPGVYCTCGARKVKARGKVLAKWAARHTQKTGHKWQGQ